MTADSQISLEKCRQHFYDLCENLEELCENQRLYAVINLFCTNEPDQDASSHTTTWTNCFIFHYFNGKCLSQTTYNCN